MTIEELKKTTNDKILFSQFKDSLLIRSLFYRYADFLKIENIESIEKKSKTVVKISIPSGSAMGDREISVDLSTGIVTADGKVFNEPLPSEMRQSIPTKKKSTSRFTPTINGFSIKDVHTMPSEDGYACYCKVYFNGKKVGDFVDKGDGGEYSFYADPPYSRFKIEEVIRSFPSTNRDYGFGPMVVSYDMNQLVNDLMEMKEIAKELKKLEGSGRDFVTIDEWKTGKHLTCTPLSSISDEELSDKLDKDLQKRGLTDYETNRYRSLEDLNVVNTFAIAAPIFAQAAAEQKTLTIYASVDESNTVKLLDAFMADTGIHVEYTHLSSGPALSRIEVEAGNPQADVWFGAPSDNNMTAKKKRLTIPYISDAYKALGDKFKDSEGYWRVFFPSVSASTLMLSARQAHQSRNHGKTF